MKVKVKVYNHCKYDRKSKKVAEAYYDIESFEVLNGNQIDVASFGNDKDDFDEYLVLHLSDGETSTFRNSYVDLFIESNDTSEKTAGFEVWKDDEIGHEYPIKTGFSTEREAVDWIEDNENLYKGWHLSIRQKGLN